MAEHTTQTHMASVKLNPSLNLLLGNRTDKSSVSFSIFATNVSRACSPSLIAKAGLKICLSKPSKSLRVTRPTVHPWLSGHIPHARYSSTRSWSLHVTATHPKARSQRFPSSTAKWVKCTCPRPPFALRASHIKPILHPSPHLFFIHPPTISFAFLVFEVKVQLPN
jgi:hypothetical protein